MGEETVPLTVYVDRQGHRVDPGTVGSQRIVIGTAVVNEREGSIVGTLSPSGPYAAIGEIRGSYSFQTQGPVED